MDFPSLQELYDLLHDHGPLGLHEVADKLYGNDVVEAKEALDELTSRALIEMVPPVMRMTGNLPRRWAVIEKRA